MMGRTSDEEGETSAKTYRSDDTSERPLKKARYVWQIKGKYHLKKPENEEGAKLFIADETQDGYTLHPIEITHCESGAQGQDSTGVADTVTSIVSKPESTSAISPAVSEIHSPMASEDPNPLQLQKWQARQVARCFVDNTINRVLEDMGFIPLPVDAEDIVEEYARSGLGRNDDHLEDAAVMMAIHSHGLQRAVAGMKGGNQNLHSVEVVEEDTRICSCSLGSQSKIGDNAVDRLKRWYVPAALKESVDGFMEDIGSDFVRSEWIPSGMNTRSEEQREGNGEIDSTFLPGEIPAKEIDSQSKDTDETQPEEFQFDSDTNMKEDVEEKSCSSFEHTDFMDKAVAVAIQKKGLSALSGIEYG